jgi:large subunit ribosomal protein L4
VNLLAALKLSDKKTLLVLPENNKNVVLSGRNIQNTKITTADQINTYDLMNADNVIFVESAVSKVENLLNKE